MSPKKDKKDNKMNPLRAKSARVPKSRVGDSPDGPKSGRKELVLKQPDPIADLPDDKRIRDALKSIEKEKKKALAEVNMISQQPLEPMQLAAAKMIGQGKTDYEIIGALSLRHSDLEMWRTKPNFMQKVNEHTMSFGHADKGNRIRQKNSFLMAIWENIEKKKDELEMMSVKDLARLAQEFDKALMEETDTKDGNKQGDLSIVMVNYFKERGFEASKAGDILNNSALDEYIVADFEEIQDGE